MAVKRKTSITSELLLSLGIDPEEGVMYLESKDAVDMNPVHVRAVQLLREPVVSSS